MKTIQEIIDYMETTSEDAWGVDVVRSRDGKKNCFFGHLFNMGKDQRESNELWEMFEELWSTTFMIYPINDGENSEYQQPTPKQRVIAYLKDLRDGKQKTTYQHFEEFDQKRELELSQKHTEISEP